MVNFPSVRQTLDRRSFLGGFGATTLAGLAGCIGGSRDPASVEATLIAHGEEGEETLIDGEEQTVEPGDFYAWEFFLQAEYDIEYIVEVTEGPDIGVYGIEHGELDRLRNDGEFEAIEGAIWTGFGSVNDTITLGEGEYWLLVVNEDIEPTNA